MSSNKIVVMVFINIKPKGKTTYEAPRPKPKSHPTIFIDELKQLLKIWLFVFSMLGLIAIVYFVINPFKL